ncbi:MAG TPA: energy transducer TonB, partial [Rhizomicrobium sp.]|nr:energy transducer TonB [Rhizomicrobium sp.]
MRSALLAVAVLLILGSTGALSDVQPQPAASAPVASANDAGPSVAATLLNARGNNCAATSYPATAIRLNHQGSTTLTLHIDDTGKVSGVDVAQSSGFDDLDQASVDCAKSAWHFTPATKNGKPVASTKQYRIVWKLTGPQNVRPWLKMDPDGVC